MEDINGKSKNIRTKKRLEKGIGDSSDLQYGSGETEREREICGSELSLEMRKTKHFRDLTAWRLYG